MKAVICDRCGKVVENKNADKEINGIALRRENGFLTFELCFRCYERYVGMVLDYIGKGAEE